MEQSSLTVLKKSQPCHNTLVSEFKILYLGIIKLVISKSVSSAIVGIAKEPGPIRLTQAHTYAHTHSHVLSLSHTCMYTHTPSVRSEV